MAATPVIVTCRVLLSSFDSATWPRTSAVTVKVSGEVESGREK
jgi:hypothetical protein